MNPTPPINGAVRMRPGRRLSIRQALDLQELCYDTAFQEGTKPVERAQLARAWVVLEEQKRILRGKLKPGSINGTMAKDVRPNKARQSRIVDVEAVVRLMSQEAEQSP